MSLETHFSRKLIAFFGFIIVLFVLFFNLYIFSSSSKNFFVIGFFSISTKSANSKNSANSENFLDSGNSSPSNIFSEKVEDDDEANAMKDGVEGFSERNDEEVEEEKREFVDSVKVEDLVKFESALAADNERKVFHGSESIYALMVTGKDDFHCRLAFESVRSFLEQTYEPKVLYIVEDGDYSMKSLEEHFQNIKVIDGRKHVLARKSKVNTTNEDKMFKENKLKLGQLRNIILDAVPLRSLFVQWDDDDYHHPLYMETVFKRMTFYNVDSLILKRQIMYNFNQNKVLKWKLGNSKVNYYHYGIVGTILARKRKGMWYDQRLGVMEDFYFWKSIRKTTKYMLWDNEDFPEIYIRFIHGDNTWDASHFVEQYRSHFNPLSNKAKAFLADTVKRYDFYYFWDKTGIAICPFDVVSS